MADVEYVVCNECDQAAPGIMTAQGCPNPGCFRGLADFRVEFAAWEGERRDYLARQPGYVNAFSMGQQWEVSHPRPVADASARAHSFRPWVPIV